MCIQICKVISVLKPSCSSNLCQVWNCHVVIMSTVKCVWFSVDGYTVCIINSKQDDVSLLLPSAMIQVLGKYMDCYITEQVLLV